MRPSTAARLTAASVLAGARASARSRSPSAPGKSLAAKRAAAAQHPCCDQRVVARQGLAGVGFGVADRTEGAARHGAAQPRIAAGDAAGDGAGEEGVRRLPLAAGDGDAAAVQGSVGQHRVEPQRRCERAVGRGEIAFLEAYDAEAELGSRIVRSRRCEIRRGLGDVARVQPRIGAVGISSDHLGRGEFPGGEGAGEQHDRGVGIARPGRTQARAQIFDPVRHRR